MTKALSSADIIDLAPILERCKTIAEVTTEYRNGTITEQQWIKATKQLQLLERQALNKVKAEMRTTIGSKRQVEAEAKRKAKVELKAAKLAQEDREHARWVEFLERNNEVR